MLEFPQSVLSPGCQPQNLADFRCDMGVRHSDPLARATPASRPCHPRAASPYSLHRSSTRVSSVGADGSVMTRKCVLRPSESNGPAARSNDSNLRCSPDATQPSRVARSTGTNRPSTVAFARKFHSRDPRPATAAASISTVPDPHVVHDGTRRTALGFTRRRSRLETVCAVIVRSAHPSDALPSERVDRRIQSRDERRRRRDVSSSSRFDAPAAEGQFGVQHRTSPSVPISATR